MGLHGLHGSSSTEMKKSDARTEIASSGRQSASVEIGPCEPCAAGTKEELPPVLTVDELARLLRINRETAYKAVKENQIPGVRRIGRSIRVSRDAVLDWLGGKEHVLRSRRKR